MADYEDQKYTTNGYDEYGDGYDDADGADQDITSEDCWKVIGSFFESKGLVSMQIESFNEFMRSTMQDLVNEQKSVTLDQMVPQDEDDPNPIVIKRHEVLFGKISLSSPTVTEGEGTTMDLMPNEARLRGLTYSSAVYVNMQRKTYVARERPWGDMGEKGVVEESGQELFWQEDPN